MYIRLLLSTLVVIFAVVSVAFLFFPRAVADIVSKSRIWVGYLRFLYGISVEDIRSPKAIRWMRIQGLVTFPVAIVLVYAMLNGFPPLGSQ